MEKPQRRLFSNKVESALAQFNATAETVALVAGGGLLEKEIRAFLVSVAGLLKQECQIRDWKYDVHSNDDGYYWVEIYPTTWDLPKPLGPVAFCVSWSNPFGSEFEDLYVGLRIPWNWVHALALKAAIDSHIPEGFTD